MRNILGNSEEIVACIDVEPGGARAAIVALRHDGRVHVIAQAYSLIVIESESPDHSVAAIADRIDDVCKRALEKASLRGYHPAIHRAVCVVHSPWTRSEAVRHRVEFTEDTKVKDSHIAGLAKQALADVKTVDVHALVEAAVVRTWLNGYPVEKIDGKVARSVSAATIMSDMPEAVKRNIESALSRAFPIAKIEWRSATRAIQTVLGHAYMQDENYLAVDMGVDSTYIVAVRDGMTCGERIVPEGLRNILSRIDAKRPAEETLGMVRMLAHDACEGTACEQIQKTMAVAEIELAKVFGDAFGALAAERRLANTLVLFAHADIIDWMKQFFSRLDFTQFTETTLPFLVVPFDEGLSGYGVDSDEALLTQVLLGASLVNTELNT